MGQLQLVAQSAVLACYSRTGEWIHRTLRHAPCFVAETSAYSACEGVHSNYEELFLPVFFAGFERTCDVSEIWCLRRIHRQLQMPSFGSSARLPGPFVLANTLCSFRGCNVRRFHRVLAHTLDEDHFCGSLHPIQAVAQDPRSYRCALTDFKAWFDQALVFLQWGTSGSAMGGTHAATHFPHFRSSDGPCALMQ